jgi:hypothetical protein
MSKGNQYNQRQPQLAEGVYLFIRFVHEAKDTNKQDKCQRKMHFSAFYLVLFPKITIFAEF